MAVEVKQSLCFVPEIARAPCFPLHRVTQTQNVEFPEVMYFFSFASTRQSVAPAGKKNAFEGPTVT